jgi:hypothetical protein
LNDVDERVVVVVVVLLEIVLDFVVFVEQRPVVFRRLTPMLDEQDNERVDRHASVRVLSFTMA